MAVHTIALQRPVWPFRICRQHLRFSGHRQQLPSKFSLGVELGVFVVLDRWQHLKRCLFVFLLLHFLCSNPLELESPRIVPSDDACDAYEAAVQHIVACREGTEQESVVYLESLAGRWVAYHAVAAFQVLDSLFDVAFVQQCYVDNEVASLLDLARTSQVGDGDHVGGKTHADRAAL